MIWLIWRQYRLALILVIGALVLLSSIFVMDASTLNSVLQQHQSTGCLRPNDLPCSVRSVSHFSVWWRTVVELLSTLFPALVGAFLGAPLLAREYEQHTHLFVWTQSMGLKRWLAAKLVIVSGITVVSFSLLALVTTWWSFFQDNTVFSPWDIFTVRGPVFVAAILFGLLTGVMMGALVRRSIPAALLTFLLLLLFQGLLSFIYPHLIPPLSQIDYYKNIQQQHQIGKFDDYSQDLIMAHKYLRPDGSVIEDIDCVKVVGSYAVPTEDFKTIEACFAKYDVRPLVEYQRFSERFWPLQYATTALLLSLSCLVTVVTFWLVQRRTVL